MPSDQIPFHPVLSHVERDALKPLLQRVEKPGRYVGGEYGIPKKDHTRVRVRALLMYPDTYELGMSNQGIKILYDIVNQRAEFLADRQFVPWPDMSSEMLNAGIPLYSLDNFLEVVSFDLLGFNIAHELHYTNILHAIDLAHIPLLRKDRRPSDPIIISGGSAVSNPLPLFDFLDAIFIGDGEEAILEIMELIDAAKTAGDTRQELLNSLQRVEGLLLPHLYKPGHKNETHYPVAQIKKRVFRQTPFSVLMRPVVPSIAITQNRVVLEIARGCGQGCRFCHAGFWNRPVRNVAVAALVDAAGQMIGKTGLNVISLHSLSIADYPWLEDLVSALAERFGPQGVSISLPSLRVQERTIPVLEMTQSIRRSSVTFALEAGSEIMRARINKKSSEKYLHRLMRMIYERGWNLIKVYFMLGLPDSEGREINDLIVSLNAIGDLCAQCGNKKEANIAISLFVPKPFTTFQWEKQQDPEYFLNAINKIKKGLRTKRVHLKYPDPWMACIEGLLSRSDSRMGAYILKAYKKGARFDSWNDHFDKSIWETILNDIPREIRSGWLEKKKAGQVMPWEHFIAGTPRERLLRDYEKFEVLNIEGAQAPPEKKMRQSRFSEKKYAPVGMSEKLFHTEKIIAVEYGKEYPFIYIGHLDTTESLRRAARRAGLPMTFSEGFNKHEKFHFEDALPLYFFSENERVCIELYEDVDIDRVTERLAANMPPGLLLNRVQPLDKLEIITDPEYRYRLSFTSDSKAGEIYMQLRNVPEVCYIEKAKRKKKGSTRGGQNISRRHVEKRVLSAIKNVELKGRSIEFDLESSRKGAISITDLLKKILDIPVTVWNSEVKIIRIGRRITA